MSLEIYLQDLAQNKATPKHADLVQLSSLNELEMEFFRRMWPSIPTEQRRVLMNRLVTVAEDNVELDYISIFKYCLGDEDAEVRARAVTGLWECDDRNLVSPLMHLLKEDSHEQVRASAATVLGKFGALAEDGKLLSRDGERIKELLFSLIEREDESLEVRRRVLESAAILNTPRIAELVRQAYNSQEPKLRISAIFAMGRTGDISWLPVLIEAAESTDPAMRYEATSAFAELGEEDAVPYLIPLIQDDDTQVQLAALQSLGAIGGSLAKRALLKCLQSSDDLLEEAAERALEQLEMEENPAAFKFQA